MNKVIVYIRHDRHTDDLIKVFAFSDINVEKVKQMCIDDWGSEGCINGYDGDFSYGVAEDYYSYYHVKEIEKEEKLESRGDFHDFDYEPDDISFLEPPSQIGTSEPLIYKTECLLELILEELIQIRNNLN
jgi:hypothetical protein